MKTPINSGTLRQHLTYSWWKYLLIAVIAFGLVDLLYTVTAYHAPRDKTVGLYVYGYVNETELTPYLDNIRQTEMPDMEEVNGLALTIDDTYGPMQLMTYLAAGEGDIYLLPREQFLNNAMSGSLLPLENDAELLALFDSRNISLQSGWRRDTETGETHLYGIPLDSFYGFMNGMQVDNRGLYATIMVNNQNDDNVIPFFSALLQAGKGEKENWVNE